VRFIDSLTNVYVRYNRKRLKGKNGPEDTLIALAALYDVLLTVCKVMAPFTPFFTGAQQRRRRLPAVTWPVVFVGWLYDDVTNLYCVCVSAANSLGCCQVATAPGDLQ
jgi:hypothetical protein